MTAAQKKGVGVKIYPKLLANIVDILRTESKSSKIFWTSYMEAHPQISARRSRSLSLSLLLLTLLYCRILELLPAFSHGLLLWEVLREVYIGESKE